MYMEYYSSKGVKHWHMDDPQKHYAEWEKPDVKGNLSVHLCEIPKEDKSREIGG